MQMTAVTRNSLFAVALIAALALCSSGAEGAGLGAKAEIRQLFEGSSGESDVKECSTRKTRHFNEQTTKASGSRALTICERDARLTEGLVITNVVSHIVVRGTTATLRLKQFGDELEGQILELKLIKAGGLWKVDEILGFYHLDRDRLIALFKNAFTRPGAAVPKKTALCIYHGLRQATKEAITEYLYSGSDKAIEDQLYAPCLAKSE
jgi:hypothetical protein